MTRRTALVTTCILSAAAPTAAAGPTVVVDDSVPFTASDLAEAVQIRVPDTDARIHIARSGDVIVVTVGDRARAVEVDTAEPRDLARVVALVIVGLAEPTISTTPPPPPSPPPPPDPIELEVPPALPSIHVTTDSTRPPSKVSVRASLGYQRTDGGIFTTPFLASLAAAIGPHARFVVSAGLDGHGTHIDTTTSVLGRAGLEGRFGALGIEIGGAGFAFRTCSDEVGTAGGVYGTARVYVPLTPRTQFLLEMGGYYMHTDHVVCGTSSTYDPADSGAGRMTLRERFDEYAGHVGIGVEWGL